MRFTRVVLENWKNFLKVDVELQRRVFLVGPNASGKSNLLDAFRFLRDVAEPEGGFQPAISRRGGVSQIRSLHARRYPNIAIDVEVDLDDERWRYRVEFSQDKQRRAMVQREVVWRGGSIVDERPDSYDKADPNRLTQTHLQQVAANRVFRSLADALGAVRYLHLVPQLVREPDRSVGRSRDPFGGDFLEQLARTPERTLKARFRKIQEALRVAVPRTQSVGPVARSCERRATCAWPLRTLASKRRVARTKISFGWHSSAASSASGCSSMVVTPCCSKNLSCLFIPA